MKNTLKDILMAESIDELKTFRQKFWYGFVKTFSSIEVLGLLVFILCMIIMVNSIKETIRHEGEVNTLKLEVRMLQKDKDIYQDKIHELENQVKHLEQENQKLRDTLLEDKFKLNVLLNDPDFEAFLKYNKNNNLRTSLDYYLSVRHSGIIYDVDWRLITELIYSESRFKDTIEHKDPNVIGLGGIHTKYWTQFLSDLNIIQEKQDLYDTDKNIESVAVILKYFLDRHNGNVFEALHSYKGRGFDSKLNVSGKELALKVANRYQKVSEDDN